MARKTRGAQSAFGYARPSAPNSGAPGTEPEGSRPGLTPRHSGTIWTTYQLDASWRIGGGLNARSSDHPVGLPANSRIAAPKFLTADLMAEYSLRERRFGLRDPDGLLASGNSNA